MKAIKANKMFRIHDGDTTNEIAAWTDNSPSFVPKSWKNCPSIQVDSIHGHRDSLRQQSTYFISVRFFYSNNKGYKAATKAFSVIHDIILKEYPLYFDTTKWPTFKNNPPGIVRSYYKTHPSDSDLNLEISSYIDKHTWTVHVFNGLTK